MISKAFVLILIFVTYCAAGIRDGNQRSLLRPRQTVEEALDGGAAAIDLPPGVGNFRRQHPSDSVLNKDKRFSNLMNDGMEIPNMKRENLRRDNEQNSGLISNLRGNMELPDMSRRAGLNRKGNNDENMIRPRQSGGAGTMDLPVGSRRRGPGSDSDFQRRGPKRVFADDRTNLMGEPNELPNMGGGRPSFWRTRMEDIERSMRKRQWSKNNWGTPEGLPRNDGSISRRHNKDQTTEGPSNEVISLLTTTAGGPYATIQNIMNNVDDPSSLNIDMLKEICKNFETKYCKTQDCFELA